MKTIDVQSTSIPRQNEERPQTTALQVRQSETVGQAMSIEELTSNLAYIRQVMKTVMKEGQDYGKIPGTGPKPTLLQPGAQKLLMTFQLTDYVKKEVLREYPNWHREYEFVVCVKSATGREWDGVGTCSTLEKKYRYRQASRKCPQCGKETIFKSKNAGEGWFCWTKKGGCGANFKADDGRIANQSEAASENPDIADCWNTVRKMAFKRALVAAAINATNTSELWTQDLEERQQDPNGAQQSAAAERDPEPQSRHAPEPEKDLPFPTAQTRARMIRYLAGFEPPLVLEYFVKCNEKTGGRGLLLPTETLEDLDFRFVPASATQLKALWHCIKKFEAGGDAVMAFTPHVEPETTKKKPTNVEGGTGLPGRHIQSAGPKAEPEPKKAPRRRDPEWWRGVILHIPPAGVKRDEYLKSPQTLGQLYEWRHQPEHAKRLMGFIGHYEVKTTWTDGEGKERPRNANQIAMDETLREALDACGEYWEKHHGDTEQAPPARGSAALPPPTSPANPEPAEPAEDDVPF